MVPLSPAPLASHQNSCNPTILKTIDLYLQIIRAHRLEREADYAAQREQEWEQALEAEAQRHRCNPAARLRLCTVIVSHLQAAKLVLRIAVHASVHWISS